MLIQAATGDPLLDEARELTDHAQDCGVDARFELFPVDTHDFHIFWSFLPEAAQALQQAGRFARDTTLAAQAPANAGSGSSWVKSRAIAG